MARAKWVLWLCMRFVGYRATQLWLESGEAWNGLSSGVLQGPRYNPGIDSQFSGSPWPFPSFDNILYFSGNHMGYEVRMSQVQTLPLLVLDQWLKIVYV